VKPERVVRRSQAISPFGVGAIMDMLGESFVAEDASRWRGPREVVHAPRIAAHFKTTELRTPPGSDRAGAALPYLRFPQWLFCGTCRQMSRWSPRQEKVGDAPRCSGCSRRPPLVPMRFVAVCGNGHLDEVDWKRWAHSRAIDRNQKQCGSPSLEFRHLPGVGGGLESVQVRCRTCRAHRDLRDLVAPSAMARIGVRCSGRQPWQSPSEAVACEEPPVVTQRGASSVYFPEVVSAIDLPPDSDWSSRGGPESLVEYNDNFKLILANPQHPLIENLISITAHEVGVDDSTVRRVLSRKLGQPVTAGDAGDHDLPRAEWQALTSPQEDHDPRDHFITRRAAFPSPYGHGTLQSFALTMSRDVRDVVLVERLREIRVLQGFRRHTMKQRVPAHLGSRQDFLPAIEVFGEGVFIRLDEERVADWASDVEVRGRCEPLRKRLAQSMRATWLTAEVTPRLVLVHTVAHLLMRQMAFAAGYSSSSLRERLYAAEPGDGHPGMAGILIYTAAGDSEGTLGGLARLGEAERLVPLMAAALNSAQWCSLDPVCRESPAQGPDGLSLAACHACTLASETSCVLGNVLLDRMLVADGQLSYFTCAVPGGPLNEATGH
jgi:hypothetical protein